MANNCLVTKLKSVANNNELPYLGYLKVGALSSGQFNFSVDYNKVFSDDVLKNGGVIDTISRSNELRGSYSVSNGDFLDIPQKYSITVFSLSAPSKYSASVDFSGCENIASLTILNNNTAGKCIIPDSVKNSVTNLRVFSNVGQLDGTTPISFLKGFSNLQKLTINSGNFIGDINTIVDEAVTLTELNANSLVEVYGSLSDFAQSLNSRRTGTLKVNVSGSSSIHIPEGLNQNQDIYITFGGAEPVFSNVAP